MFFGVFFFFHIFSSGWIWWQLMEIMEADEVAREMGNQEGTSQSQTPEGKRFVHRH